MSRWSLRDRLVAAVVVTFVVAFTAGALLLAALTSVHDDNARRARGEGTTAQTDAVEQGATLREVARRRFAVSGLLATAVAGGLGWVLIGTALSPLARLRAGAAAVAETSDLSRRVPTGEGPAEIDLLARTINAMLARLEAAEAATRAALDASRSFAAGAAHELRTPLTTLQTDISTLDNAALDADERAEILTQMREEHARLVRLLDQLLALARGDLGLPSTMEPVDVGDVVETAVHAARRRASAATIEVHTSGDPVMRGSTDGIRLAVDNLLENAVRHGGGRVEVAVRAPTPDHPAVLVQVDDDGSGIAPSERARVLGRFERGADPTASGSGLGLALVQQQVTLHEGRLVLTEAPTGGLRVQMWFPSPAPEPVSG